MIGVKTDLEMAFEPGLGEGDSGVWIMEIIKSLKKG